MDELTSLLNKIKDCNACGLMEENRRRDIRFVPILPKPNARFVFIGRDPNPNSVKIVGLNDGKSSFIKQVFNIAGEAGINEADIYITDICKCHWRTSGNKNAGSQNERPGKLPKKIAEICIKKWLIREVDILQPEVVISFGEEVYNHLKEYIIDPERPPDKLSATMDKSELDAELYVQNNGPFTMKINSHKMAFIPLRHAGNTERLKRSQSGKKRWEAYLASRERVVELLKSYSV